MALVPMKLILDEANKGGYGAGAFNVNIMDQLQPICVVSAETYFPVIILISGNAIRYVDKGLLSAIVSNKAEKTYPSIAMAHHLDHGPDIETIKESIDLVFTSVVFDGSLDCSTKNEKGAHLARSFDDNVAITKEAVEIAHAAVVTVEGKIDKLECIEDDNIQETEPAMKEVSND